VKREIPFLDFRDGRDSTPERSPIRQLMINWTTWRSSADCDELKSEVFKAMHLLVLDYEITKQGQSVRAD
jgi:hypothetical protein